MALNKLTADALVDGTLDADAIGPASITTAKLHSNIISGQTAIGSVDASNDLLLIYDNDATSLKKVPVSSVGATNTDSITEGSSNLYYTNARADARAQLKIDALVDSAPGTLDTLNELAAALGDDANFSTTVTNSIATKLPLAGGTMTGALVITGNHLTVDNGYGISSIGGIKYIADSNNDAPSSGAIHNFYTDNGTTSALVIQKSGNVGIGTTSPTHMLEVKSGGNAGQDFIMVRDSDNNQQFRIYSDSSTGEPVLRLYNTSGSAKIVLHANGVSRFEGGNVGIGTDNPGTLLDVRGEVSIAYNATYGLRFYNQGRSNWSSIGNMNTSTGADLTFKSGSGTMVYTHEGRLGLGTASPYAILQTQQDVTGEATGISLVNNNVDGSADAVGISFGFARDNGYLFGFNAIKWIKEQAWTTNASTVDAALTFSTVENESLGERLRIKSNGNVGIGTTNPGFKLHVAGGARIQGGNNNTHGQLSIYGTSAGDAQIAFLTDANGRSIYVDNDDTNKMKFTTGYGKGVAGKEITMDNEARLGIGTTSPGYQLHLRDTAQQWLMIDNGTSGNMGGMYIKTSDNTDLSKYFRMRGYYTEIGSHNNEGVRFLFTDTIRYTFRGTVGGNNCFNAKNASNWDTTSDERIKTNIKTLEDGAIDKIKALRPVTFDYTDDWAEHKNWHKHTNAPGETEAEHYNITDHGIDEEKQKGQIGWIAQEYKTVFPKDVYIDEETVGETKYEDFHQLNPESVIPTLVKALQEAVAKIDALETRIKTLES